MSRTTAPPNPRVAICAGKDCRKKPEFAKMRRALDGRCDVVELACIGLCSGPVAVTDIDADEPVVLSKVRSKKQRKELVKMVVDGRDPGPELERRVVVNGKRAVALRKAARHIA